MAEPPNILKPYFKYEREPTLKEIDAKMDRVIEKLSVHQATKGEDNDRR